MKRHPRKRPWHPSWRWSRRHTVWALRIGAGTLGVLVVVQLLYPGDRLVPWQRIDGLAVGLQPKQQAAAQLDAAYRTSRLQLYFGDSTKAQFTPKISELGLAAHNTDRLEQLHYPWYLRLVPTSLLWAHRVIDTRQPTYTRDVKQLDAYLARQLGSSCQVPPKNATAKVAGDTIVVVPQDDGGTCQPADVKRTLSRATPSITSAATARIAMTRVPAKLTSRDVQPVVDTLNRQLARGIVLAYDSKTEPVAASEVRAWLRFSTEGDVFDVRFDAAKADSYLQSKLAKAIERPAGVTKVSTHDFVETARQNGAPGRRLDSSATLGHLKEYLLAKSDRVPVGTAVVTSQVQYTRSYSSSDAGLSALMQHYAESHPGTYGVSLIELDGKRRRANYHDTQKFTTASTYKTYVAYSALKRVESGEFKWSDQVSGGRDLTKCFDDMIVRSDNACAEALVARIGYSALTKDAQTIVSGNTTFLDKESYKTTAGDLSTFMASLATGQIALSADHKARFVDALKRNIYRQGIPAGASGTVADKVGFLDGLLHDAAIVYSPSGTYVLSIMTDGSSWADIAGLARELSKLRNQ